MIRDASGKDDWACPYMVGDILVCVAPTNFHSEGEIVIVTDRHHRWANDSRYYWVTLYGKPGHYDWESFRKATVEEIGQALSAQPK